MRELTAEQISVNEQINLLKAQLNSLKDQLPKVETKQHIIERRELNNLANDDLLSFSKVVKVVRSMFIHKGVIIIDYDTFAKTMTTKQLGKVDKTRYEHLIKSPKLVVKMMTPKVFQTFKDNGKFSANGYMNILRSALTLSESAYKKKKSAKEHYTLDK